MEAGSSGAGTASKPGAAVKASARDTPTAQLRQASWDRQLDAFVRPGGSSPPAHRSLRARLADAVKAAPESPEGWWALLQQEEAWSAVAAAGATAGLERGVAARGGVALLDLYRAATKTVPRQNNYGNEAFIKLWLGFARQQWARNADDARDVFKMLRSQHVGGQHAALYYEWAALEAGAGGGGALARALGVLAKGLKEQAQPADLLEQAQSELQAGRFVYRPPWAHDGGGRTAHSAASSLAAFLTPGGWDERRSAATPTADVSAAGAGATDTLIINRGGPRPALSQPVGAAAAPPAPGSGDTDTLTLRSSRPGVAPPSAGVPQLQQQQLGAAQHTAGLTDGLGGGSGGGRTSHTIHSGSTVGSDDPTATLRMKTPAGGLSIRTGGSTDSLGEEATVSLRRHGATGARRSGEGCASADQRRQQAPGDDTLVVNRAVLPRAAAGGAAPPSAGRDGGGGGAAGASSSSKELPPQAGLLKPRRLGVLGKAQRVVPGAAVGRPPLAPPAAAATQPEAGAGQAGEDAGDANRKRKAEVEALLSPKPPLSVGDGKRRQSPEDETKAGRPPSCDPPAEQHPAADERAHPPVQGSHRQPEAPAALGAAGGGAPSGDLGCGAAPSRPPVAGLAPAATAAAAARRQVVVREGEEGGEEDETAPVVLSKLAQRVQRGRQSLAPSKIVLGQDGSLLPGDGGAAAASPSSGGEDDAPTLPVSRLGADARAAAAAAAQPDADATRPLVRHAAAAAPRAASPPRPSAPRVQIDGAGNVAVVRGAPPGAKPLPVPPPPPPSLAEAGGTRMPMGPPPPKPARAAAPGGGAAQPAARPGRRVVEDENTVTVKDIQYTKLECVGRGGSSKVYKVMAPNRKIFALKRIRLQGRDAEAASGFLDEIRLLNGLAGRSNIIQLIDSEVHRSEGLIYMVLEYGDIDLARLLQKHEKARREREAAGGQVEEVDENFVRLYWEQMLQAVDSIHRERIVHSDLKPANFLVVEGQLKLIDFGIAKAIQSDTTSIARESQVGTLNYMSPEAILGGQNNIRGGPPMKVGRPSDIWSLGCILYQMVYGQTPFSHLPFIQKMHAIIDPAHRVSFPPLRNAALGDAIRRCLDRNPRTRITMQELLAHPFLRPTQPAAPPGGGGGRPGSVELSREQLTKLLAQVAAAGVNGSEVGQLSDQLFSQLSSGLSPDLVSRRAAARSAGPTPSPAAATMAPPQRASKPHASVADAAASAAAARAGQRAQAVASLESRQQAAAPPAAAAAVQGSGSARAPLAPISQAALAQQAAALRRVQPADKQPAARQPESGLEAALRKGLERFRFDDATGGDDGGNTTGGFGDT